MNLKPCPYRRADEDGQILCEKIKRGDREVTPNVCRVCPIAQIACAHLRATLEHHARPPIIVRWGNGRSQVWDDFAQDSLTLTHAACAEKVLPIQSPRECVACALRRPLERAAEAVDDSVPAERRPATFPRTVQRAPRAAPPARPAAAASVSPPAANPDARSNIVAQKIIQLQEWLAKQPRAPRSTEEEADAPVDAAPRVAARVIGEEKRVGWTD